MKRIRGFHFFATLAGLTVLVAISPRWVARSESISGPPQSNSRTGNGAASRVPSLEGEAAIEHLKQQGTYGSLQEAMAAIKYEAKYQPQPRLAGLGAAHELSNRANNLLAYVTGEGIELTSLSEEKKPWRLGLKLTGCGYGDELSPVGLGQVQSFGNRVSIRRSAISNPQSVIEEWFVNTARGIEQGFTIDTKPAAAHQPPGTDLLRLRLQVSGDLSASIDGTGRGAAFSRESDTVLVSYDKLFVMDAKGRGLPASMKLEGSGLVIEVDDAEAQYPLTIDPLFRELTKLTASDGAANDSFGISVAVSGDTVVVGAYLDDVGGNGGQGSAYVFVRSGVSWSQQAKLTALDGATNDNFGNSVGVSGDMVVVGAPSDDVGANAGQGSAYVFVRSGTSWVQQAKLTAADGAASDTFGGSVAVSGDTVIVGADDDDVGANSAQGSAYVFVRSGVSWTQQGKLTAADGAPSDDFGFSVAISGDTVVVGADGDDIGMNGAQGSAYVFVRSGAIWTQQAHLIAADGGQPDAFGWSVAISGDTVVVGAVFDDIGANVFQGSAYVFVRSGTTWTHQAQLTAADGEADDRFGVAVAISGDTVVVGALLDHVGGNADQGSVYAFVRSGTTWTQQAQLTASDGEAFDEFANSVAISGDTVVVGSYIDNVGMNGAQGSAYLFVCNWTEQQQLTAADGAADDRFGFSVAISGDTVVVGAFGDDVGANVAQGSAYVFVRSGVSWSQQQQLTAADGAAGDNFGVAVAVSGDTLVVGAFSDDVGVNPVQGSAYVFVRSGTVWSQQQQLTAADGAVSDQFGVTVAVSGDTVIVGADLDNVGASANQGSAYVFVRSGVSWSEQAKITAADGAADDRFGVSVGLSGDTVVVGALGDDVGVNASQGSAYVYVRSGVSWTQQQQLTAADGAANDNFGNSVAVSGDTAVVGAFGDDVGATANQGSAYVFVRSGTSWSQQAMLTAADGAALDLFGRSVGVSGDTVVVGADDDDVGANAGQGSAYVFMRSGASWYERQQLTASDGAVSDDYGISVAVSGNTIITGADLDNVGANSNQGSAYIYFMGCNTAPTAAVNNVSRQKGNSATISTVGNVFDSEDPIGYLTVTVASAPTGIQITGITNTNGVITASIAAPCNATLGNNAIVFRIQDSDGGVTTATMVVNVTGNTVPSLGAYADTAIVVTNALNVTPSAPPADNGSIVSITANSPTFAGGLNINPDDGVVIVDNARPGGVHVVTVTAMDNCGASRSRAFILTVNCQTTTVDPETIPAGTAGSAYLQVFTQPGGNGAITFSLSGTLPTGLSFASGTATLSGTPTEVGSFPITVTATDQNLCSGSRNYTLTINAAMAMWNGTTSSDWHTATNWSPNIVPTTFTDVVIPASGVIHEPTIVAASSAINAMTIQAGRILTIDSKQQLSTASDISSDGQITGAGKLCFDGASFRQGGSVSVALVEFDSGTHALTGGGLFASNIITVLNGANVTLTSNHSVSVIVINSGGAFDATNQTLTLTGAGTPIFNSGTFTATGSTIVYQGSVAQVVTANIAFNNLTIDNAAGVSLAADTTASGVLNLAADLTTGVFTLTMPNTGTSTGAGDVVGTVKRTGFALSNTLSFGNPLNTIQFISGTAPSDVTVNLVKSTPAGFESDSVTRTYTITPTGGSGFTATLRLRYTDAELNELNESILELWRFNGSSWASPTGTATRDTTTNWVEETGITQFSPWAIGGAAGPTLVELISFEAMHFDEGTLLEWKTGFEADNLGFNVYREASGKRELVNHQMIAGSALRANSTLLSGEAYAWMDKSSSGSAAYWLEDVDLVGKSSWHGPFHAVSGRQPPAGRYQYQLARTLAQLNEASLQGDTSRDVQQKAGAVLRASSAQVNTQEVLSSQAGVKISVKREGLYRISGQQLFEAGLGRVVDADKLQMFVDGEEIPISVSTSSEGRFDENSLIEFYGLGIDTPSTDARVYWLTVGDTAGKRIAKVEGHGVFSSQESFTHTVERRDRAIYFSSLRNGEAENFFGAVITANGVEQGLTIAHLHQAASAPAVIEVSLQGVTQVTHRVAVQLNGVLLGDLAFNAQEQGAGRFSVNPSLLRDGQNTVRLTTLNGQSDVALVDSLRLSYSHSFFADDNLLRLPIPGGEQVTLDGFSSKSIRVFDVTEESEVNELACLVAKTKNGYAVTVAAREKGERRLLALADNQMRSAAALMPNHPSALKGATGADFVIITRRDFFAALEPLQMMRRAEGYKVDTIDVEDIYDEFSFGQKSPQSIKEFLFYAKTNWRIAPQFVMFAGDASFDTKNYLGLGENDFVPTKLLDTAYLETASDDWFADFDNDGISDLGVGRLPARTADEAANLVKKILTYEATEAPSAALLVSDANDGFDFEQASAQLRPLLPATMRVEELQRGRVDAATAKARLLDALARGQMLINYTGHGSVNLWRGNLLTATEASSLNNVYLPVFVMMNCLNGYFQDAVMDSLGEGLLKAERGGAIAVWSSSGMTTPSEQAQMNRALYRALFDASVKSGKGESRLSEAVRKAKAAITDGDIRRTWILLGDPTMRVR